MSLQPVQQEQVQATVQQLLSFLGDENVNVPGNMVEAIVSGKSLLRGIISGHLIICQSAPAPAAPIASVIEKDKDVELKIEDGQPESEDGAEAAA